jgi:hypothetical protein
MVSNIFSGREPQILLLCHLRFEGELVQLRALDWATNGPFQEFPAVLVYHPSTNGTNSFALLSFVGFVGALSGVSNAPVGICEKVWLTYNGTSSREGNIFLSWTGEDGRWRSGKCLPHGLPDLIIVSCLPSYYFSGHPWHFVLRDILMWDKSVDDAINRVNQVARTCSIFIGVGDPEHKFRVMEYSYEVIFSFLWSGDFGF